MCKVIIKTREALSVTSERLFNSLTLVMFLSHIVCYMFQFRVIQSFSAQYNKRRNKQKDITKTNFRDVRMSKNKLKRIGIIGIISSRIGIIFILIRGQNYFHYSQNGEKYFLLICNNFFPTKFFARKIFIRRSNNYVKLRKFLSLEKYEFS